MAGERDQHRSRLDALAEARRGGVADIFEFEETLGDLAAAPDVVVVELLLSYRAEQAWDRFFAVVERMGLELAGHPFVLQQRAFALNRAGRGEEAGQILLALREEQGPSPETNGILGRVYKDRFMAAREAGDQDAAEAWLQQAIDTYFEGHGADPSDPYPGLNALSLMEFASPKPARRDSLFEEVSAASRRRLLGGAVRYWDYATEWELAVIEGDEQTAQVAMGRAVERLEEPWQADSTRYNIRVLEAAWVSRGVNPPDWVGPLAGRLESASPADEPPPTPGARAAPAERLPDLPDFLAGDRDEHQAQLEALVEASELGTAGIVELEGTLGTIASAPDVVVMALMLVYRAEQAWDPLFALVARMRSELAGRPFVRQQHAFALNRAGRGVEAEKMLLALREEHGPSPETNGILGRVYKDWFQAARAEGDEHTAGHRLRQAIDTYLEGHDADPSDPYPGLNALSLMEFSYPRPARRDSLLGEVTAASRRRLLSDGPDYWDYATEWELAVLDGDELTAGAAMERATERVEEPWQAASTSYNTRMLQAASSDRGQPVPRWVSPVAAQLDAIIPSGGSPEPSAGPPVPATPPGGPGLPSTPPDGPEAPPVTPGGPVERPSAPAGAVETPAAPTGTTEPEVPPTGAVETPAAPTGTTDPEVPPTGAVETPAAPTGTTEPEVPPAGAVETPAAPAAPTEPVGPVETPATPTGTTEPEVPPSGAGETPAAPTGTTEPDVPPAGAGEPPPGTVEEAVSPPRPRGIRRMLRWVKRLFIPATVVAVVGAAAIVAVRQFGPGDVDMPAPSQDRVRQSGPGDVDVPAPSQDRCDDAVALIFEEEVAGRGRSFGVSSQRVPLPVSGLEFALNVVPYDDLEEARALCVAAPSGVRVLVTEVRSGDFRSITQFYTTQGHRLFLVDAEGNFVDEVPAERDNPRLTSVGVESEVVGYAVEPAEDDVVLIFPGDIEPGSVTFSVRLQE